MVHSGRFMIFHIEGRSSITDKIKDVLLPQITLKFKQLKSNLFIGGNYTKQFGMVMHQKPNVQLNILLPV